MRRFLILVLTLVSQPLGGLSAQEQGPVATADQALAIERQVASWLADTFGDPGAPFGLQLEGSIRVEPVDDHYRVSIPAGLVGTSDGSGVRFGAAEMVLTPTERRWYDIQVQLPDRMALVTAGTGELAELTLGEQRVSVLLAPEFRSILGLDLSLGEVRLGGVGEDIGLGIGRITATAKTETHPDGLSTMTLDARIQETNLIGVPIAQFALAEFGMAGRVEGVRLEAYLTFAQALGEVAERLQRAAEDGNLPSALRDLATFLADTPAILSSLTTDYWIEGAYAALPHSQRYVRLDQFRLTIGGDALDAGAGHLRMLLDVDGLSGPDIAPEAFGPQDTTIEVSIADLPNDAVFAAVVRALEDGARIGLRQAAAAHLRALDQTFTESGSEMQVGIAVGNPDTASIGIHGHIQPAAAGPLPAGFDLTIEIGGLRDIRDRLLPRLGPNMMLGLALTEAVGEATTDAEGRPITRLVLATTPDGRLLINGQDASELGSLLDN